MKNILHCILIFATGVQLQAQWSNISGPGTNAINAIAQDGNTIVVGTQSAGMFLTSDHGNSWRSVNGNLVDFSVQSMYVSPVQLLTGVSMPFSSYGVFQSVNNGILWKGFGAPFPGKTMNCIIKVDTVSLVATGGGNVNVVRTKNDGLTWESASNGIAGPKVNSLTANGNAAFAATDEGIFRSTDLGSSWTKVRTNTLYVELSYSIISAKGNIYVANSNGGVNSGKDSIYKSTDNGDTWVKINNNLPAFLYGRTLSGYGDTIFVGQVGGVYRSLNGGQSWQIDTVGLGTNAGILSSSISGNVITMGTSKGIAVSTNNGNNWTMLSSNMYNGDVMGFVNVGEKLMVSMNGTNDKGIYRSLNHGVSWSKLSLIMAPNNTQTYLSLMFEKKGALFGTVALGGVYASFDTGATWKTVNSGLSATATVNGFYSDADTIYGCMKEGLFRTTNNGTSWVNWGNTGFPVGAASSMTIVNDTMYVSNGTTKLYLSGNRGRSWISKTVTLATGQLMLHKNRLMTLTGGKLYWAPDTGSAWPEVNTAFGTSVQSVLSLNNNMFVRVSSKGMYLSTNSGAAWTLMNQGIPTSSPTLTFLAAAWDTLYAGFSSGGIVRRGLSEFGITKVNEIHSESVPKDISLSQNYPNPFNPATKINFTLSQSGLVSLKVYDAIGREVATIVQEQMNAGSYTAEFNGSGVSSGVYFYRLISGTYISMRKMVLMK